MSHSPWQAPDQPTGGPQPGAGWPGQASQPYAPPQPYGQPHPPQPQPGLVLPYPLAETGTRVVQGLIDALIIAVPYYLAVGLAITFFVLAGTYGSGAFGAAGAVMVFLALFGTWGLSFYHQVYRPYKKGDQTFGMERKDLRIVKTTGGPMTMGDHALRWLMYVLVEGGPIALILIASTRHKQRLGDMVAKTVVVQLPPENHRPN